MAATLRDLVTQLVNKEGWKHVVENSVISLTIPQKDGRTQTVRLQTFEHEGETLVRFTSVVGKKSDLTPERYEKALELNFHLPYGHLAIDGADVVITETRPLKTTTADTSGQAIKYIARQADLYEKLIFQRDVY